MGLLINGEWADQWYDTKATGGKFVRTEAQFRNWITADGSAGPSGNRRVSGRIGTLSSIRFICLPLGASHADLSRSEGIRGSYFCISGASRHVGRRLGFRRQLSRGND